MARRSKVTAEGLQEWARGLPLPIEEASAFLDSLERLPPPSVRLRPAGRLPDTWSVDPVPWFDRGFLLSSETRPAADCAYGTGAYYIQDAGSLLALALVEQQEGAWLCDLCAAPGGKATALAETLPAEGWLLANEPVAARLPLAQFNLARHGAARYVVSQLDPARLAAFVGPVFDTVLVDAPCSGQSLWARGKQTLSAFQPRTIEHSASRQARILDAAVQLVRPGGRLIYATCTFSVEENEAQIAGLLARHPQWQVDPSPALTPWQSEPGCYRLWPHRHPTAGAFAARVRRTERDIPVANDKPGKPIGSWQSADLPRELNEWGALASEFVAQKGQQLMAWPDVPPDPLWRVAAGGPEVSFCKGKTWFPAYALAMRRDPRWNPHRRLELDQNAARSYLAGRELPGAAGGGWAVAQWRAQPLGWVKGVDDRWKNHLPKQARLAF